MAKNKYQLLANHIAKIQMNIDLFYNTIKIHLEHANKPQILEITKVKTQYVYMQLYGLSPQIRELCKNHSYSYSKMTSTYKKLFAIDNVKLEAFLCCIDPCCTDDSEINLPQDLFKKEDHANSLTNQLITASELMRREKETYALVEKNLRREALPYFDEVIKKWQNDPEGHDTIVYSKIVYEKPFAPKKDFNLAQAYEAVRSSSREGKLRNYKHLQKMWQKSLETLMFEGTDMNENEKRYYIWRWENEIFGVKQLQKKQSHEKEQSKAIDRQKAAKIIRYFTNRFLQNPNKFQTDGVTACILWTCFWISSQTDCRITIREILEITTVQINETEPILHYNEEKIELSSGLHQALLILRGKGRGNRACRLFPKLSERILQQHLKKASITVLDQGEKPIAPGAFLIFPHPHKGTRLSKKRRQLMRR